jgi:hypothetical protein
MEDLVMKEKSNVLYGIIAVLAAAVAVIPFSVLKLIETKGMHGQGMKMACETTCLIATVLGAALVVVAVVSLFVKNVKVNVGGSAFLLAGGIGVIIVPHVFGLCKAADMACRYITLPTLSILGGAIIVLSLARLVSLALFLRKTTVTA